jgi:hypothetical protein
MKIFFILTIDINQKGKDGMQILQTEVSTIYGLLEMTKNTTDV